MGEPFYCGHDDEWAFFAKTYEAVLRPITEAHDTLLAFLQRVDPSGQQQTVLHMLGQCVLKEFEEILLLAGNGYGSGCLKLLRALYERVVTLGYLAQNPEKVQQFIDYSDVHWHKLIAEAQAVHSEAPLAAERVQDIEARFDAVRENFTETLCKVCGTKKLQISWTKAPIHTQASKVHEMLRNILFNAYLRPTFFLHTTYFGITQLTQLTPEGKLGMMSRNIEHLAARDALALAHLLLLQAMDSLNTVFKLNESETLQVFTATWVESWEAVPEFALNKRELPPTERQP